MGKFFTTLLILSGLVYTVKAQDISLHGRVTDDKKEPIPYTNIRIVETSQYGITDVNGDFKFSLKNLKDATLTLEFSFIGYQKLSKTIKVVQTAIDLGTVVLKELSLSLETIDINAKRDYEGQSNSSLIISRDIIEQTPALSLSDLLNQIPNRKVVPPSLQSVQNITLRSTVAPTTDGRGAFQLSNAFGVAIIIDGNAISNNMNMQSFNPGGLGAGNSLMRSGSTYGLNASKPSSIGYTGDYTFGGTDLRQIPADNIESVEIIAGVAPAKYGDLSEGAVIVERQAGKAPGYVRMQLRDNATSYGYAQGFKLSPKAGSVNVGVNYVSSFADNRDKFKAYKRLNLNSMYTNTYFKDNRLKNTLSLDYGRNLDGFKRDEDDITQKVVRFDSWNLSIANRSSYRLNTSFLKNVSLNLRYAEGHQVSYQQQLKNEPYIIVSEATSTGIHQGSFEPGVYTAASLIDGRPVNATAKLDFNGDFKTGIITHFLGFGISYDYGANKGAGQVLDPNKPRFGTAITSTSLTPKRSERYYDFNTAVAQQNVGLYAEDAFNLKLFNRDLNVRAGIRYDIQNALASFSPRLNTNYALGKNIKIGFAYGLAYKSPSLAQRYPGPSYYEIPLLSAFNGNAAESIYLVYVNRFEHDASHVKSAKSQTFEFTSQINLREFNLSIALFSKDSRDGIGMVDNRNYVTLPTYAATLQAGRPAQVVETGYKSHAFTYQTFANDLLSDNQGLEIILNTPRIKQIATGFNLSGGLFRTNYQTRSVTPGTTVVDAAPTRPDYGITAFYEPTKRVSYLSNLRLSSSTHIPKISLIVSLSADFGLLQKTIQPPTAGIPLAYLTRDGRYIEITNFDPANPDYGQFYKPASEINDDNVPVIVPNFNLSLAKEIKKRFRFSFNVYNVFNNQPYYTSSAGKYKFPNAAPSFGAEISLKL